MTDSPGPRLDPLERRLQRLASARSSPELKRRILVAIDDVLAAEKVPATKDGWSGDFVAVTAFSAALGIALAVALLAVAPRPHTGPLPKRADDTFVNQTTLRVTDARRLLEENL